MQHNNVGSANLLIHQKVLDIGSLIALKLNNLLIFLVLLNGSVAGKILLKGLANALNVQIIGETSDGRDTLATISLLHSNVNFLFGVMASVASVFKGVCESIYWKTESSKFV